MWESAKAYLGNSLKHGDSSSNNDNVTPIGAINETFHSSHASSNHRNTTVAINTTAVSTETSTPVTIGFTSLNKSPYTIGVSRERNRLNDSSRSYRRDLEEAVRPMVYIERDERSFEDMDVGKVVDTTNGFATSRLSESSASRGTARPEQHFIDLVSKDDHSKTLSSEDEVVEIVDPASQARFEMTKEGTVQHPRVQDIRNFFTPATKSVTPSATLEKSHSGGTSSTVGISKTGSVGHKRLVPLVVVQKLATTYRRNPDEFILDCIRSRFSSADGSVTYVLKYKDGHTRDVSAFHILDCASMEELERFENDLFDRNENMETDYYPRMKPPGGNASGGTAMWMSKKYDKLHKKAQMAGKEKVTHKHNGARSLMVQARTFEDSVSSNGEEDDMMMSQGHNTMMGSLVNANDFTQPSISMTGINQSQSDVDYDGDGATKRRRLHVNYNLVQLSEKSTPGVYLHNGIWSSQPPRKRKRRLVDGASGGESSSRDSNNEGGPSAIPLKKKPGRPVGWKKNSASISGKASPMPTVPLVTVSQPVNILPPPSPPASIPQVQPLVQSHAHNSAEKDSSSSSSTPQYWEDEGTFAVEKIVSSRIVNGQRQFCLKWLGYDDSFNEWLAESELVECEQLVKDFQQNQQKKNGYDEQRKKAQAEGQRQQKISSSGGI